MKRVGKAVNWLYRLEGVRQLWEKLGLSSVMPAVIMLAASNKCLASATSANSFLAASTLSLAACSAAALAACARSNLSDFIEFTDFRGLFKLRFLSVKV